MKTKFPKIFLLFTAVLFIATNVVYAQSCNTLKEIFENSDYCDKNEVSIHGKVYELLDNKLTLQGSKYVYGFQITDDGTQIIRVVSPDDMVLVRDSEVVIDGRYYKKLYADGLNLDDTIVASGKNIKVILTADELWNEILGPWGASMEKEKALARRNIIFAILIPLVSAGAFWFGLIFYRRRQIRGATFEGYVENLFSKQEWRIAESNAYRKLGRWVESYSNPDFVFIHRRTNKKIAVECKYKEKEYERILWAYEDQIERYQNFSQKQNIPVFVILGIGGRPKNPKRVFLAPLSQIKYPDVKIDYLEKFERDPKKYFSLDNHNDLI
ncbi:MAG: hypothetical protein HYW34_01440 [Candidatus Brennerbacteria bacterium]|nr:hypothetical protein [Candidatus Brennerbacteria bacterium]